MMVIAHRGASGEFPENSLLAFEQAITQGADGIELDIQFHQASGEFLVLHDAYLDKTTNGVGHYTQHSINTLKQLQLGEGQKLITLPEAMALIKGQLFVNIELKTSEYLQDTLRDQFAKLNDILTHSIKYDNFSSQQIILSSFNHLALHLCGQELPSFLRAALISHYPLNIDTMLNELDVVFINPDINCLNKSLVDSAHHRGFKVLVYTVDRVQDIQRCFDYGVDGIFTNYPEKSRQLLDVCKEK